MARPTNITAEEIAAAFNAGRWRAEFPPILTPKQAGKLLGIGPSTLSLYTQMGTFDGATGMIGKHRRYWRDRIVTYLFPAPRNKQNQDKQEEKDE
jgi:hypothetical protein